MSCCGKNSNLYTRAISSKSCCNNKSVNTCCNQSTSNNSCCNQSTSNNSCCNQSTSNNSCCNQSTSNNSCCCNNNSCLDGISCPFHNNNDCNCEDSLTKALCNLTNQRVIIHTDGCKMCVVIVSVGNCFVKTINPCTQRIVYFNINRIDNVEDVLPRCY